MKRKVLLLFISGFYCFYAGAQSFQDEFIKAFNRNDMTKAEEILKAWDLSNANDPELYIAFFNFYTFKSMNAKGPMTTGYDRHYSKQALEFITEGIERFPLRLDMRVAKIYLLSELKAYPEFVSEILKLIVFSNKIKNDWKDTDFLSVENADDTFFGFVTECQEILFSKEDSTLFKDILRISDEMLKYYPKHVQSRIAVSTVYIAQKEFDKSLNSLLKALEMERTNVITLFNIAYVYVLKGDATNARKYYELTIKHSGEKEIKIKEAAEKELKSLP